MKNKEKIIQWIKCFFGYHPYEKGTHTLELGFTSGPGKCQRCPHCKKYKTIYHSSV